MCILYNIKFFLCAANFVLNVFLSQVFYFKNAGKLFEIHFSTLSVLEGLPKINSNWCDPPYFLTEGTVRKYSSYQPCVVIKAGSTVQTNETTYTIPYRQCIGNCQGQGNLYQR